MKHTDYVKNEAPRDLLAEAKTLIGGLKTSQIYDLYDVVIGKQRWSQTAERQRELDAVQRTIEKWPGINRDRLHSIRNGLQSEMAREARPGR